MATGETLITAAGPLIGVALGGWLSQRQALRTWLHEEKRQLRKERVEAYIRFITAARTWQSNVLEPDVAIATAHTGVRYADGGEAFSQTIRALAEIRLVAGQERVVEYASAWDKALRRLSESRADTHPARVPAASLDHVRSAEAQFVGAAREEVGSLE